MTNQTPCAREHLAELVTVANGFGPCADVADRWGAELAAVLDAGGRLLAAGNGGSAAQAQHLTAELVGRYRDDRPALSAIALHAETSSVTAIANDYGVDQVFARQIHALARPGDVALAISTSGQSQNVLKAVRVARSLGAFTIGLTGGTGGELLRAADRCIVAPAEGTPRIQEAHTIIAHVLCEIVERELAGG